jgi:hypothetical protein
MKKIAILLPGELRFQNEDHFNSFLKYLEGYDIYISTYPKYSSLANKISNNVITTEIDLPQDNMYQWHHLDNIIKKWKDELLKYDILIKLRTDIEYSDIDFQKLSVKEVTIYPQTDQIFYGQSSHFIKTYEDMYDNVINYYYVHSKNSYLPINYENLLNSDPETDVKVSWLRLPETIYSNEFSKIQEKIKLNQEKFLLEPESIKKMEMIDGQSLTFKKITNFTTERCFLVHTINKGMVSKSEIVGTLIENRKKFNWDFDRVFKMKIKNTPKEMVVGSKIIDINKMYHYIHGKDKKDDRIINIKNSPTVKYLAGDIEEYINGSKAFDPRIKSFPFLNDLFDKGEWLDVFVYHHRDIYIVLDGMHRSSILYHNKLENVKVLLIDKFPFRNKNIDNIIQES